MRKLPVILVVDDDSSRKTMYRGLRYKVRVIKVFNLHNVRERFKKNMDILSLVVICGHDSGHGKTFDTIPVIRMMREMGFESPIIAVNHDSKSRMEMSAAGCSHDVQWRKEVPFLVLDIIARQQQK